MKSIKTNVHPNFSVPAIFSMVGSTLHLLRVFCLVTQVFPNQQTLLLLDILYQSLPRSTAFTVPNLIIAGIIGRTLQLYTNQVAALILALHRQRASIPESSH